MKETYILYAYTKPWEHLINLTGEKLKKLNSQHPVFGIHQAMAREPKEQRSASPSCCRSPGVSLPSIRHCQRKGNREQDSGRRKHSRTHVPQQFPKTSSKTSHRNSVSFLVWKTDSEVKCQGHDRQNSRCLNLKHRHLLGFVLRDDIFLEAAKKYGWGSTR